MAYFDYNATTPLNPEARRVLLETHDLHWANPSSPYRRSAQVHTVLEHARDRLAKHLGKSTEEVIFNGGATEANNAVIRYLSDLVSPTKTLVTSPFEHPSVSEPAQRVFRERLQFIEVNADGVVDLNHLQKLLRQGIVGAVSVMAVNNETGVVQPWQEIGHLCHQAGIPFHCDASQWFGKCPDGAFDACDFLVGCGHKFGAPKGVGFLALSKNTLGFRSSLGGGQEAGRRGGTENIPSILAMLAALEYAEAVLDQMLGQAPHRDDLEDALLSQLPDLVCLGKAAMRVPGTAFMIMPRFENLRWVRKLDLKGFEVSTGSACSTGETSASSVLNALGYGSDSARRTIRISAGPTTIPKDWIDLGSAILEVWDELNRAGNTSGSEVISI